MFRIQTPGDFLVGNPEQATEVALDYLALLQDALVQRGLDYRVVSTTTGTDLEVPNATGDDIRLTDREVILARGDVETANSQGANYAVNLEIPIGGAEGLPVTFLRGWVSVDARIGGQVIRFASTHLERAAAAPIQVFQAGELQQILSSSPYPVALAGDLNSRADGSGTESYGNFIAGGFVDAWSQVHSGADGYTCCHANDLMNETVDFNRRIDHILLYGEVMAMEAQIVGVDPAGRTAAGLWASDHAGMVAQLGMGVTAVLEEHDVSLPASFALAQNYPNPFNSSTLIRFALPQNQEVELTVHNLTGQKVATLVQGARQAGTYTVHWNGRDDGERDLASGMYLYRLQAGSKAQMRKLVLLK
jgi:endonuclease/exonuclease/phosphatase family metal-dependent hydrolase